MIEMTLLGALCGIGVLLLLRALRPPQASLAEQAARLDFAGRGDLLWVSSGAAQTSHRWNSLRRWLARRLGTSTVNSLTDRKLSADLALLGLDPAYFVAGRLMTLGAGFLAGPLLAFLLSAAGEDSSIAVGSLVVALAFAGVGFIAPVRVVTSKAAARRADFRAAVTSYMDLVAMRSASGAAPAEALHDAAEIGQGWPFARIRLALRDARLSGYGAPRALGHLGEEIGMHELEDLSAQLMLAEYSGGGTETTLRERARSLRDAQLTAAQGKAGERSQTMIVAQLLLGAGFLLFLLYPPLMKVLATL